MNNWTVNLSRVRPAWRYWYRGEAFNPDYPPHQNELNYQWRWKEKHRYDSLVEFAEVELDVTLEVVKQIAPEWYLQQLQRFAKPLESELMIQLPEVIKEELRNPRYKLIYKNGKIIGRYSDL